MPLELWKDMAERFLDPTSFGRLRQVNKALRDKLDEESREKMVKRCTIILQYPTYTCESFMNRAHTVFREGTQIWFKNGKCHRDDDLPAYICADGSQSWYREDKRHRDNDKPAVILVNGTREWWKNGQLHRDGGLPTIIFANGNKRWYKDGKRIK